MREDQEKEAGSKASTIVHSGTTAPSSVMMSLRSIVVMDDNNGDDDEDSFVFNDHIHQDQEFENFSEALKGFGLIHESEHKAETEEVAPEKTPLLKEKKVEKQETTVTPKADSPPDAYVKGQKELFLEVLDKVEEIQNTTRKKRGFKGNKFAFGLVNCLLIAYMFGAHPEHFWILYAVETFFWMTYKFRGMYNAKPLSEALYYLDFCWVMNATGVTIITVVIVLDSRLDIIPYGFRKSLFLACFGVFCGPVFMAAMVLPFVAFLFHDVNTMANLIIHLMPSMVMYNFRFHAVGISSAYPTIFRHLVKIAEEMNSNESPNSLIRITLGVYFVWFTLYTAFMLLVGMKLPVVSKDEGKPPPKYDTVFHTNWRGGVCEFAGTKFWGRSKEVSRDQSDRSDFEVRDFLVYMAGHAFGSCLVGIVLVGNILCFHGGKLVHASLIWITTILCAKRGADRYTYYVTSMYGHKLRKAFKELEVQEESKKVPKIEKD